MRMLCNNQPDSFSGLRLAFLLITAGLLWVIKGRDHGLGKISFIAPEHLCLSFPVTYEKQSYPVNPPLQLYPRPPHSHSQEWLFRELDALAEIGSQASLAERPWKDLILLAPWAHSTLISRACFTTFRMSSSCQRDEPIKPILENSIQGLSRSMNATKCNASKSTENQPTENIEF